MDGTMRTTATFTLLYQTVAALIGYPPVLRPLLARRLVRQSAG